MMAGGVDDIASKRANAANGVIEDLKRNGVPEETAHDLLNGYVEAIEGYYK